jgi:hypothetical protein
MFSSLPGLFVQPVSRASLLVLLASGILVAYPVVVWISLIRSGRGLRALRSALAMGVVGVAVGVAIQQALASRAPSRYSCGLFPFSMLLTSLALSGGLVVLVIIVEALKHAHSRAA